MTQRRTRVKPKRHRPEKQTDGAAMPLPAAGMNEGQRAAMEVAESARDATDERRSFGRDLFTGDVSPAMLWPFPQQSAADRAVGDEMVRKVAKLLRERLDPELADETREIPADVVEGLQELGVFKMKVPVEYGGLGYSQVNYNRVLMAIASYCGSTAVLVSAHQSIGVPNPLKMFGTEAQKEKYLRRIADGDLSAFALTEPEVGSDPAKMTTTAILSEDGSHYVLNGTKLWTTNGPIADLLVVMAQTDPKVVRGRTKAQITAFIVETDTPGFEVLHRCDFMGLRAIHNGVLKFTDVKVPAENVLWGEGLGLKLALRTLNTGRLTLPAACTGMGKQCLAIARQWGNEREQWGLPVGKHEAGRDKIARIAANTLAMEAVTWLTSHWADQQRDIRIEAAMAKLFCSEVAWRIVDETMQFRGGRGYERATSLRARGETAWPIERVMRDCRINLIIEGTSDIMRLFLAREALDPHLKRALPLMTGRIQGLGKVGAGLRLGGFYAAWYTRQRLSFRGPWGASYAGRLARHARYVERASHKLARTLFHAMALHGPKLERRQMLLARLMDIGTDLFAMSATLAYATTKGAHNGHGAEAAKLADLFARQTRARVAEAFRTLKYRAPKAENDTASAVLEGRYRWLEAGVVDPRP